MHSADSPRGGHAALPVETRESPLLAPGASVTPQLLTWPGEQLTSSDHHELDLSGCLCHPHLNRGICTSKSWTCCAPLTGLQPLRWVLVLWLGQGLTQACAAASLRQRACWGSRTATHWIYPVPRRAPCWRRVHGARGPCQIRTSSRQVSTQALPMITSPPLQACDYPMAPQLLAFP